MFEPRQIEEQARLNKRQIAIVVLVDILLLGELTFSIYLAYRDPENLTPVFLKTFLPMAVGTLIAARFLVRKFRKPLHWQTSSASGSKL